MRQIKFSDRRKKHSRAHYERKSAFREPRTRILIVSEGSVTERVYFERFVQYLGLTNVDVDIHGEADSAPISVVRHANTLRIKEGKSDIGGYSIVYCVMDRDTHASFDEAIREVQRINGECECDCEFVAIPSFPCFEIWFLMHISCVRTPIVSSAGRSPGDNTVRALREHADFSDYDKKLTDDQIEFLIANTNTAVSNSVRASVDAANIAEPNPSTMVHQIIQKLLELRNQQNEE